MSEYTTGNLARVAGARKGKEEGKIGRARNARGEGERKPPATHATGNFAISTKPGMKG